MARYQGGKKRIGLELYETMKNIESKFFDEPLPLLEPMCGMCGVTQHFNDYRKIYASDINEDVVLMWQSLKKGWVPPQKVSEKYYNELRYSKTHSPERGFIGTSCSFSGSFFSSFTGKYQSASKNDARTAWTSISKMLPKLEMVQFIDAGCYTRFNPVGNLIYCDPPYYRTVGINPSKYLKTFDHEKFWSTMRKWSRNNLVFISEESAPLDFIEIWTKKIVRNPGNNSRGKKIKIGDKLFLHKCWVDMF